ncbi:MAG: PKD domain-containing protein [Fibrobacteria bacterium]|nr:PKD domain-containing protein [Fibrobacteria bacterium]
MKDRRSLKLLFFLMVFVLGTIADAQIIINEVRTVDETCDYCSFVELKNTGTGSQNLSGFVIKPSPSTGIQNKGGQMDNLGVTGFYPIGGITLSPGGIVAFYFGCSGTNTSTVIYIPDRDPILPFGNISLYSRGPTDNGGLWYGSSLIDFVRFGPGKEPPREVVWDWDSRTTDEWQYKQASGVITDVYVKYNHWPDKHSYIDTKKLVPGASISHKGNNTNSPDDWIYTIATPGDNNEAAALPSMPQLPPPLIEENSLPGIALVDTRSILYAASFNHQQRGDYPRDWFYHEWTSNIIEAEYGSAAKITGTFAIQEEYGERGLWISPSSVNVVNHNNAITVFGDGSWTDYRLTFTTKQTTGDFNRHQLGNFYLRLKPDTNRIEGYQFNLIGGTSISVRKDLGNGGDFGTINMHPDVDIEGAGRKTFTQLAKNTNKIVNPADDKLYVTLEAKGSSIKASYDNGRGGVLSMNAEDNTYSSGMVGLGTVYGNFTFNDILVEDLTTNPGDGIPVAIVETETETASINTPVGFNAVKSIYAGDQSKLTYLWDFGDGIVGKGQRPRHSFAAIGTYRVTCTISDGKKSTIDGLFFTVTGPTDNTPPSDVTNLQSTHKNNDVIKLSWDAASDNETGISGYAIYRSTSAYPTLPTKTELLELPLITVRNITEFEDTTERASTTFYYRIKALNGVKRQSANYSNVVSATTTTKREPVNNKAKEQPFRLWQMAGYSENIISFHSYKNQHIDLKIYNSQGHLLTTLYRGKISTGTHRWKWKPTDNHSGIIFIRIITDNLTISKKVFMLN